MRSQCGPVCAAEEGRKHLDLPAKSKRVGRIRTLFWLQNPVRKYNRRKSCRSFGGRTVTPARNAGRRLGCAALRGSSASGAGASIARGCPPRTSPPPAADLRAEARTHLPRRKVRFAQNALREWAFLAPLPCSSFSNETCFAGLPFERKAEKERRSVPRKKTENGILP